MPDPDPTHDHALARAAGAGDADALRALWLRHRRWVAAVLLAHAPQGCEIEDLLQDVAMILVRSVHTLRDPPAFRPWLRTIAINAARAAGRSAAARPRTRRLPAAPDAPGAHAPSHEARLEEHDEAARLLDLARELPPAYREPLLLRAVQGLSYRAIAEITSLPETTVETRIARARRMLRDLARRPAPAPARSLDHA